MIPKFKDYLLERRYPISNSILVLDIDETLLSSDNKVGYRFKNDPNSEWKYISTEKFAKVRVTLAKIQKEHPEREIEFDFSDFRNSKTIYKGIVNGSPNIQVLQQMDKAINDGWKIGILTARGNQDIIYKALMKFLQYRTKDGDLKEIPDGTLKRKYVFAVSDEKTLGSLGLMGAADKPEKLKAFILQKIFGDKYKFENIIFLDDDTENIRIVNQLRDPRIKGILVKAKNK